MPYILLCGRRRLDQGAHQTLVAGGSADLRRPPTLPSPLAGREGWGWAGANQAFAAMLASGSETTLASGRSSIREGGVESRLRPARAASTFRATRTMHI